MSLSFLTMELVVVADVSDKEMISGLVKLMTLTNDISPEGLFFPSCQMLNCISLTSVGVPFSATAMQESLIN